MKEVLIIMKECIEFNLTPYEEFMNSVDVEYVDEFTEIIQEGKILDAALGKGNDEATWKKVAKFIPRLIQAIIKKLGDIISNLKIVQKHIAKSGKGIYFNTEKYDKINKYISDWDNLGILQSIQKMCADAEAKELDSNPLSIKEYINFPEVPDPHVFHKISDPEYATIRDDRKIISQTKAISISIDTIKRTIDVYKRASNEDAIDDMIKNHSDHDISVQLYFKVEFGLRHHLFNFANTIGSMCLDLTTIIGDDNKKLETLVDLRKELKALTNKGYYDPVGE